MEDGSSSILALEIILIFECLERIIREVDRKLCRVCIVGIIPSSGLDDIWMLFLVFFGESIGCPFCRGCFEIIHITCCFLVFFEYLSHILKDFFGELLSPHGRYIAISTTIIQYCFVHTIESDRRKVIAK